MEIHTASGLTLRDIAILADGTGNIPDETAEKLKPYIRGQEDMAEPLAQLRQMADDAGTDLLADGYDAYESLGRLRSRLWKQPTDVLDPELDVPFNELISMSGAMAERAEGEEKAELRELQRRLIAAFGDQLGADRVLQAVMGRLLEVGHDVAETALAQLVEQYRLRRKNQDQPRRGAGVES